MGRLRLDEVMPHRLFKAPQRDGLGESETAARQEGRILVRRVLLPPNVERIVDIQSVLGRPAAPGG
jgi:hypothetical protein